MWQDNSGDFRDCTRCGTVYQDRPSEGARRCSPKRSAALPDVPTFVESGFGDIVVTNWYGIVARRNWKG